MSERWNPVTYYDFQVSLIWDSDGYSSTVI